MIKNIIELLKNSKTKEVLFSKRSLDKTVWYFTNKSNRYIPHNVEIEVSTGKLHWPVLCVLKENGLAKVVLSRGKMTMLDKVKLSSIFRKLSKQMTNYNEKSNDEKSNFFEPLDYSSIITHDEIDFIDYNG